MKTKKLKGFVLPTVYIMVMAVLFLTISFLGTSLQANISYSDLAVNALIDTTKPVVSTPNDTKKIVQPFTSEKVTISKSYYNMTDDATKQQQSLVYYENTYLQNSGILYSSTETFEVLATYDGTVTKVSTDEILGNVVEITHNTNLKTVYYSLNEVNVKENDSIITGAVIGTSGDNNLTSESENCLLFEVYYNGTTINPENFYTMNIDDLQ